MQKYRNNHKFSEAVKEVYKKISALSQEEFDEELKKHEGGDIARILIETKALQQQCYIDEFKNFVKGI